MIFCKYCVYNDNLTFKNCVKNAIIYHDPKSGETKYFEGREDCFIKNKTLNCADYKPNLFRRVLRWLFVTRAN